MTTELLLVVVVGALVGLVVAFLLRRRFLLSGLGAVTMWLRSSGSPRWSVGVGWYGGEALLWYRALSLSVRPQQRLCRADFRLEGRRNVRRDDLAPPSGVGGPPFSPPGGAARTAQGPPDGHRLPVRGETRPAGSLTVS